MAIYEESAMNCPYALRDEYNGGTGSYVTMCDCPGGCQYKREITKSGRGLVGECTKILHSRSEAKEFGGWY